MNTHACTALALLLAAGCGQGQSRDQPAPDTAVAVDSQVTGATDSTVVKDTRAPRRAPAVKNAPKTIEAVLAAHTDSLMAIPGVLGTGVGRCENGATCIRVLVSRVTEEIQRRVPRELEGYQVRVDVTGPIVPRP